MTRETRVFAGLHLLLIVTIESGGTFLLSLIRGEVPGSGFDEPLQLALFRAGHAHAGVLSILALVAYLYIDQAIWGAALKRVLRVMFFAVPLLVAGGMFGGAGPMVAATDQPGPLLAVTYVGAVVLAVALIALGVGLLRKPSA